MQMGCIWMQMKMGESTHKIAVTFSYPSPKNHGTTPLASASKPKDGGYGTSIGQMTAKSPDGPWGFVNDSGIVLRPSEDINHWTYNGITGILVRLYKSLCKRNGKK